MNRYDHELVENLKSETRRGDYLVVRTKFHRGGIVSRHSSLRAALTIARRNRGGQCGCGCVGVIDADDYLSLPTVDRAFSACDLARRD